jgi:NAD(P)H dehydrogenase (quinone)
MVDTLVSTLEYSFGKCVSGFCHQFSCAACDAAQKKSSARRNAILWPKPRGRFSPMRVLILDGHPDKNRLTSSLLAHYAQCLPPGAEVQVTAIRDLQFDLNLRHGYMQEQAWEPDLKQLATAILACDHLVVGFPLWWGAEPALLKGCMERIFLPGFAFQYHKHDVFWDRLLTGRSADVLITLDTPLFYLRWILGNPVGRRWKHQVLGFCGFHPVRILYCGPTRRGHAAKKLSRWQRKIARAAATIRSQPARETAAPLSLPGNGNQ